MHKLVAPVQEAFLDRAFLVIMGKNLRRSVGNALKRLRADTVSSTATTLTPWPKSITGSFQEGTLAGGSQEQPSGHDSLCHTEGLSAYSSSCVHGSAGEAGGTGLTWELTPGVSMSAPGGYDPGRVESCKVEFRIDSGGTAHGSVVKDEDDPGRQYAKLQLPRNMRGTDASEDELERLSDKFETMKVEEFLEGCRQNLLQSVFNRDVHYRPALWPETDPGERNSLETILRQTIQAAFNGAVEHIQGEAIARQCGMGKSAVSHLLRQCQCAKSVWQQRVVQFEYGELVSVRFSWFW